MMRFRPVNNIGRVPSSLNDCRNLAWWCKHKFSDIKDSNQSLMLPRETKIIKKEIIKTVCIHGWWNERVHIEESFAQVTRIQFNVLWLMWRSTAWHNNKRPTTRAADHDDVVVDGAVQYRKRLPRLYWLPRQRFFEKSGMIDRYTLVIYDTSPQKGLPALEMLLQFKSFLIQPYFYNIPFSSTFDYYNL